MIQIELLKILKYLYTVQTNRLASPLAVRPVTDLEVVRPGPPAGWYNSLAIAFKFLNRFRRLPGNLKLRQEPATRPGRVCGGDSGY